jgi:beta-xylosidase
MKVTILEEEEEFEDTKRVIRIRKSKDGPHNGKTQQDKRTNNDLQNIYIKLKSNTNPTKNRG